MFAMMCRHSLKLYYVPRLFFMCSTHFPCKSKHQTIRIVYLLPQHVSLYVPCMSVCLFLTPVIAPLSFLFLYLFPQPAFREICPSPIALYVYTIFSSIPIPRTDPLPILCQHVIHISVCPPLPTAFCDRKIFVTPLNVFISDSRCYSDRIFNKYIYY